MNETRLNRLTIRISVRRLIVVLPGMFYLANLIRMLMYSTTPYFITLYTVGGAGLLAVLLNKRYYIREIISFFILYGVTLFFNWAIIRNVSISGIVVNLFLTGITLFMLLYPWGYKTGIFVFYSTALLVLYAMRISSTRRILSSSGNYISVVLLLAVAFYYIAIDLDSKQVKLIDVFPAFVCFGISVWAKGRGGILSTLVLLISVMYLYMRKKFGNMSKRILFVIILILIIAVIRIISDRNLLDIFMSLGKWRTRGTDNAARMTIWRSYISTTLRSARYTIFGAPLQTVPIVSAYGGNCHNSFLQLHAYNGLLMFVAFLILLVKAFDYYRKSGMFVILVMMAVITIRAFSDKFIFSQYGMPIMLFFVLYPIIKRQQK